MHLVGFSLSFLTLVLSAFMATSCLIVDVGFGCSETLLRSIDILPTPFRLVGSSGDTGSAGEMSFVDAFFIFFFFIKDTC